MDGGKLMTKQLFVPEVPEDLNREYTVTLTEGQISTILYCLEGYVAGLDDCIPQEGDEQLIKDVDNIFGTLEGVVDKYYDEQKEIVQSLYNSQVDRLVDSLEAN